MRRPGKAERGQNLVELVLTMGLVVVFLFVTIEVGRIWQAYMAAKQAALDGAVTASQYMSPALGMAQIDRRLQNARLTTVSRNVRAVNNGEGYEASVVVQFRPMFGGLSIPIPNARIQVVPEAFDIRYDSTKFYSIY